MEQFVCFRVGGGRQPVLLIIELDHGLVNRNLIRTPPSFGLSISLVNPVVNGQARSTSNISNIQNYSEVTVRPVGGEHRTS
jgi:hypothetical protein